MGDEKHKRIGVFGLDSGGLAACRLLAAKGEVSAAPAHKPGLSQKEASELRSLGIKLLAEQEFQTQKFDLVVHGATTSSAAETLQIFKKSCTPTVSDLELAYQSLGCLNIAITGTNGKTTTADLVERILRDNGRQPVRAGGSGTPMCDIAEESKKADYAILEINSFQLESVDHFRPAIAVLLNLKPDHLDRYDRMSNYARTLARVFSNQQVFDWAVVQSEALAHIRSLELKVASKLITFSSSNRRADIFLDRGLLISRLDGWSGPLMDLDHCRLKGPHNAENIMAALAVGKILRLPLDQMVASINSYKPGPHRLEEVGEVNGVKFINNSKAVNVAALEQSLEALPAGTAGEPNIWLIAGGKDKGLEYHDLGPLLARRVKGAFVLGETREKLRAAWGLFTPCVAVETLLEAVSKAFENALPGDIVLLSPGCSSLDMFQNYQQRGEVFREAVAGLSRNNPVPKYSSITSAV